MLPNTQSLATTSSSDIATLFNDLECRLRESLEGIVQSAILTIKKTMETEWIKMKKAMESELESLSSKIATLHNRVVLLEAKTSTSNMEPPTSEGDTPTSEFKGASFDQLQSEVKQLSASINSHHKILEYNDQSSRVKNIIIVGIAESSNEQTERVVLDMLDQRLGLTDITITQVQRIGRKRPDHCRHILVSVGSLNDKRRIMLKRSQLAGSNIFINPDLTKDQREEERDLRNLKKKMMQSEKYQGKHITIFRGKICVNKNPITQEELNMIKSSQ